MGTEHLVSSGSGPGPGLPLLLTDLGVVWGWNNLSIAPADCATSPFDFILGSKLCTIFVLPVLAGQVAWLSPQVPGGMRESLPFYQLPQPESPPFPHVQSMGWTRH